MPENVSSAAAAPAPPPKLATSPPAQSSRTSVSTPRTQPVQRTPPGTAASSRVRTAPASLHLATEAHSTVSTPRAGTSTNLSSAKQETPNVASSEKPNSGSWGLVGRMGSSFGQYVMDHGGRAVKDNVVYAGEKMKDAAMTGVQKVENGVQYLHDNYGYTIGKGARIVAAGVGGVGGLIGGGAAGTAVAGPFGTIPGAIAGATSGASALYGAADYGIDRMNGVNNINKTLRNTAGVAVGTAVGTGVVLTAPVSAPVIGVGALAGGLGAGTGALTSGTLNQAHDNRVNTGESHWGNALATGAENAIIPTVIGTFTGGALSATIPLLRSSLGTSAPAETVSSTTNAVHVEPGVETPATSVPGTTASTSPGGVPKPVPTPEAAAPTAETPTTITQEAGPKPVSTQETPALTTEASTVASPETISTPGSGTKPVSTPEAAAPTAETPTTITQGASPKPVSTQESPAPATEASTAASPETISTPGAGTAQPATETPTTVTQGTSPKPGPTSEATTAEKPQGIFIDSNKNGVADVGTYNDGSKFNIADELDDLQYHAEGYVSEVKGGTTTNGNYQLKYGTPGKPYNGQINLIGQDQIKGACTNQYGNTHYFEVNRGNLSEPNQQAFDTLAETIRSKGAGADNALPEVPRPDISSYLSSLKRPINPDAPDVKGLSITVNNRNVVDVTAENQAMSLSHRLKNMSDIIDGTEYEGLQIKGGQLPGGGYQVSSVSTENPNLNVQMNLNSDGSRITKVSGNEIGRLNYNEINRPNLSDPDQINAFDNLAQKIRDVAAKDPNGAVPEIPRPDTSQYFAELNAKYQKVKSILKN